MTISWELRRSPRRRSLAVEVHPDLRVVVRAPSWIAEATIEAWVASREPWIRRRLACFSRMARERPPLPVWVAGEEHLYLGRAYPLAISPGQRFSVMLSQGLLQVTVRDGLSGESVRLALERWYRQQAARVFDDVLKEQFGWFAARGHAPPVIRIRAMVSRWGSLSVPARYSSAWPKDVPRRMSLNLVLIQTPRECIKYIVMHELCHLEHANHGRDFYQLLTERQPDWRRRDQQLAASGVLEMLRRTRQADRIGGLSARP